MSIKRHQRVPPDPVRTEHDLQLLDKLVVCSFNDRGNSHTNNTPLLYSTIWQLKNALLDAYTNIAYMYRDITLAKSKTGHKKIFQLELIIYIIFAYFCRHIMFCLFI